jgi:hypothetical protein
MTPKYHDLTATFIGLTDDAADLRVGDVRMWVNKMDMSYASWYLLLETVPGKSVNLKIMSRAL